MTSTLEDYLRVVVPYISHQLISPESLTHIATIAKFLPANVTSFLIFECRLGESQPRADFLLSVAASEIGPEILAGCNSAVDLPETLLTNPVWNRIRTFCSNWADPASRLYEQIHSIWLEFDVVGLPAKVPVPSIFFGPNYIEPNHSNSTKFRMTGNSYQWVTETALQTLIGKPIPLSFEQKLFDCFDSLPTGACIFHIGAMLARQVDTVRVCITDIPPDKLLDYLSRLGWTGSISKLEAFILELSSLVDRVDLDLDVGDIILPKIGLECYFNLQPQFEPRWQLFLNRLVEAGLCIPAKRDAILAYPGYSHERTNRELWPKNLLRTSNLLGQRASSIFIRQLNHIKFVYQPDSPIEAKAYLSAGHYWTYLQVPQEKRENVSSHHASIVNF
ncbi:MAG: hypothetical protein ICV63_07165 [Coleofasciculus sp. Co-bin14]|nr:hypothetical protein [Coleofasciculus sp. Co-bin14]